MALIYSPDRHSVPDPAVLGGKGATLFRLHNAGFPVPATLCVAADGYRQFVEYNNLSEKIGLELHRKNLTDMRWEEMWDISLTIQNLFIRSAMPVHLKEEIDVAVCEYFTGKQLVVRSSAPAEDGTTSSFAGLHSSYVNVRTEDIEKYIRKVWASLWSDRAILYMQDLGLDNLNSSMGVVIQELVAGDASGVMFTENPTDPVQMVIEAVHGLNQGLVDGVVQPDRWIVDRHSRQVIRHDQPENRSEKIKTAESGVILDPCQESEKQSPPLDKDSISRVITLAADVEQLFSVPVDIEWSLAKDQLVLLQARPISSSLKSDPSDKRAWYLSLTRSYDNLKQLWRNISDDLLPQMQMDSELLGLVRLEDLSDRELAIEIRRRVSTNEKWSSVYWQELIPFAHGVRLFGEIYNDVVAPVDPFEFIHLLSGQTMLGTARNMLLEKCAQRLQNSPQSLALVEQGLIDQVGDSLFQADLGKLKKHFSMGFLEAGHPNTFNRLLSRVILEYCAVEPGGRKESVSEKERLKTQFLDKARDNLPVDPGELLELARASYRIRDDDNIYLGRIGVEVERGVNEARKRVFGNDSSGFETLSAEDLCSALEGKQVVIRPSPEDQGSESIRRDERVRVRQIQGQPASNGFARGMARVIHSSEDLGQFKKGEILVIDSIDPTMTFFAPLAGGIVERRGGMLIHGAIIAREYGIPCVTGVVDATAKIRTGDTVTVDGCLGICTVQRPKK